MSENLNPFEGTAVNPFENEQISLFEEPKAACCEAPPPKKVGKKDTKETKTPTKSPAKPGNEPENDLPRYVIMVDKDFEETFPPETTLEDIRQELEKIYPAYTKQNTRWSVERQEDKGRYLCIPIFTASKGG